MPKVFTSDKQKIGLIGEDSVCNFLEKEGFDILERNYTRKWGEIDIIAKKDGKIYFCEVKSTSVTHETPSASRGQAGEYRPEDNMHPWKIKRLSRTIQTYLLERNIPDNADWQFDVLAVFLDMENRTAKIRRVENVIL